MMLSAPLYKRRTEWQNPAEPVRSLLVPRPADQRYQVIHWTGGVNSNLRGVPTGAVYDEKVAQLLRNVQHDYLTSPTRGYSIGYNWCVPQDDRDGWATVWELRGDTYRCAANGDQPTNIAGQAILLLCETLARATPSQIRSVRWLIQNRIRNLAPQAKKIVGHCDVRPGGTACPGVFIPDVREGVFQPLPPTPPPQPKDDDMALIARFDGDTNALPVFYTPTTWRRAKDQHDIDQQLFIGQAKFGPDGKPVQLPGDMAFSSKQV